MTTAVRIVMILSPAKTLDLEPMPRAPQEHQQTLSTSSSMMGLAAHAPASIISTSTTIANCEPAITQKIAQSLKIRNPKELAKLLGISQNLAKTATSYWKNFVVNDDGNDIINGNRQYEVKPAIYTFAGDAYQGLDVKTCSSEAVQFMQQSLRIIDPVYGTLRPLDVIQPYRLEMATRNVFPDDQTVKLAQLWKPAVTKKIEDMLMFSGADTEEAVLLNLASDEYAAAVDLAYLSERVRCIKVVFTDNGRVISISAKRARGLMVRYIAQKQLQLLEELKQFDLEGYKFQEDASNDTTLVFNRVKSTGKRVIPSDQTSAARKKGRK